MGIVENTVLHTNTFKPGQMFTVVGSRNTPYLKVNDGYLNLVTLELTIEERGDPLKEAKLLGRSQVMRKYKLSHVQYEAWLEYIDKNIKPKYGLGKEEYANIDENRV